MRRSSGEPSSGEELELRPRFIRRGWGRVDGAKRERAAELVRENAGRSARRRANDRRVQVVRDLLARRMD